MIHSRSLGSAMHDAQCVKGPKVVCEYQEDTFCLTERLGYRDEYLSMWAVVQVK